MKKSRYANTQPMAGRVLGSAEIDRARLAQPIRTGVDALDEWIRDIGFMALLVSFLVGAVLPQYIWWILLFQGALLWRLNYLQLGWLLDCPDDQPVSDWQALREWSGALFKRAAPGVKRGDGLVRLGNAKDRWDRVLSANLGRLVTHAKVFGTTGGGKTQWLLGVLDQVIAKGSGTIFVDGKADIVTWFLLYQICRAAGREDDLLVINYLTGGTTQGEPTKHTNTNNLFAFGSSDSLMEMMSALMGEAGGNDGMWRGRAEALGRAVLRALCELRDMGVMTLSVDVIREHITLEAVERLAEDPRISEMARVGLVNYLNELPGWKASQDDGQNGQPSQAKQMARAKASEQHGYLAMQWTSVLELLGATYKAITRTDLSEVDFRDVILNRRILYIMLPAIEKSPESLKNLGRQAVTAIRNALTVALGGARLSGSKDILVDGRPTNASVPFIVALDEYGSYCVEGFADVAAQARSLGIATFFMGQDYPSFKKGSEIEAERIEANTGISVFLKTENAATADLAIRRAGKMMVATAEHIEPYQPGAHRRKLDLRYRIQEVDRITLRELAAQGPGEARVIYGDEMWHIQSFYGDYKPAEVCQVNTFVRLHRPELSLSLFLEEGASSATGKRVGKRENVTNPKNTVKRVTDNGIEYTAEVAKEVTPRGRVSSREEGALPKFEALAEGAGTAIVGAAEEAVRELLEPIQQAQTPETMERAALATMVAGLPAEAGEDAPESGGQPAEGARTAHSASLLLAAAQEYIALAKEQKWDAWQEDEPMTEQQAWAMASPDVPATPEDPLPQQVEEDELARKLQKLLGSLDDEQDTD